MSVTDHLASKRLTATELRRALRAICELSEVTELEDYPVHSAAVLRRLIPCDIASYNAVDPSARRVTVAADPADSIFDGGAEVFAQFAHQNPLISHYVRTGDGTSRRISDFISRRELHRTELYHHVYRHIQVEHQLAVTVPSPRCQLGRPSEVIGLTVSRAERDFTDAEQLLLQCLRPHFASTLHGLHELALARAISAGYEPHAGRWLALMSRDGTVAWSSPAAAQELGLIVGERLPAQVHHWLMAEHANGRHNASATSTEGERIVSAGRQLCVRLVKNAYPQLDALHLTAAGGLPGAQQLRSLALTRRQAEVLALALEGQTSAAIADSLTLSRRTVEKHFEAIYSRLDVTNRTQAITTALQALDASQVPIRT